MIRNQTKNQLLIVLLAVGFFIGILYENVVCNIQIFQTERLQSLGMIAFEEKEYWFYILRIRIVPLIMAILLWNFRWRRATVAVAVTGAGISVGRLLVSAILMQGAKGVVLCTAMMFPHMIFYGFTYLILLMHLYNDRRRQWNKAKTIVVFVCWFIGVWSEVCINPQVLKWIIGWI